MSENVGSSAGGSGTMALGEFPRELYRWPLKYPEWSFLSIFIFFALLSGTIVLLLSRREMPDITSGREIVEIQERYARIVLNLPKKAVREKRESARQDKTETKKEVDRSAETEIKEEPRPEPPVTEEEVRSILRQEIGEMIAERTVAEEIVPAIDVTPDLPDLRDMAHTGKYGADVRSSGTLPEIDEREELSVTAAVPEIEVETPRQYDVRSRSAMIDMSDADEISLNVPQKSSTIEVAPRYDLPVERKRASSPMIDMEIREKGVAKPAVTTAPDIRTNTPRRRIITGKGGGSGMPAMELRPKDIVSDTPAAPDLGSVPVGRYGKKGVASSSQLATAGGGLPFKEDDAVLALNSEGVVKGAAVPDIRAALPRKGGSKGAVEKEQPTIRKFEEEPPAEKIGMEQRHHLPETATIHNLTACVDPAEEKQLKRKILAEINGNIYYCEDDHGKFAFYNMQLLTTFDVRFVSRSNGEHNRCDALRMALQCLTKQTAR